MCKINNWQGKELQLHLDHINSNKFDNRLINLQFLCPSCHSQTETYCRGLKNGRYKIASDELLKKCYEESSTLVEALLKAGLTTNNGNYKRLKKVCGL